MIIQQQLLLLPPKKPQLSLPHTQLNKIIRKMMLHPFPSLHPHPQFVAAKSLMFYSSRNFIYNVSYVEGFKMVTDLKNIYFLSFLSGYDKTKFFSKISHIFRKPDVFRKNTINFNFFQFF